MGGYRRGIRPVTVAATTAPNSVVPITAPCRLVGWSLAAGDITSQSAIGSVTSPGAQAVIASLGTVPAGTYTVDPIVELGGTVGAGDANNFGLYVGATLVATSINPGAVGTYQQANISITVPVGGAVVQIRAIAAGTLNSVYTASIALTGGTPSDGVIYDGGQAIGTFGVTPGLSDTEFVPMGGIDVGTSVAITVTSGTISGVIYVTDKCDDEDDETWLAVNLTSS